MHSLVIISLQVTVETMRAQLSCHVQNYGDHFVRTFGWYKNEISTKLELRQKIFGSQVPISRFMSTQSKAFYKYASCTFAQNKDPIRSQFCTCHDNRVVMTYANFSHDRIISVKIRTSRICQYLNHEALNPLRADSTCMFAPSQWETSLQSNAVSHWLGAYLKSVLPL